MGVDKLYESENYILVNKPFDMYINSDDENEKNTVSQHIGSPDSHLSCSDNPLHFVQRLDYSTSGVLCIAKNKSAAARAGKLFEKRETRKYYLAIVRGHIKFDVADIEFDVGVDPLTATSSHRMVAATSSTSTSSCVEARKAQTRLLALELGTYDGDPATVVLLKPITGRRHQLRVHCAAVEHTILGDYTYSNRLDSAPHRMFLHANRLILPLQTEPLDIQTPEPFFSDSLFTSKWKSEKVMHKYRGDDFKVACDTIDASYVVGLKYARFNRFDYVTTDSAIFNNEAEPRHPSRRPFQRPSTIAPPPAPPDYAKHAKILLITIAILAVSVLILVIVIIVFVRK